MAAWIPELKSLLALPRGRQWDALQRLRAGARAPEVHEAWNTAFADGSLFDAWTGSSLMRQLYAANASLLDELLVDGDRVLEIGAGDGRLWRAVNPHWRGELVVIDPIAQACGQVGAAVHGGVSVQAVEGRIEQVELPAASGAVCSLTLHHVAGWDAAQRAQAGMNGPGKLEVLRRIREACNGGWLILNEADVHCDLTLAAGSEVLRDHLFDSYVRRAARALAADVESEEDEDLRNRLLAVIWHWCLEQVDLADVPVADRDVYELDTAHWLELLHEAGYRDISHRYTDDAHLFCQYLAR